MDKKYLIIGGTVLIVGGLAYWYLSQQQPQPSCSDYTNQSTCENAGCYWYNSGCHSSPQQNGHHCEGDCFYKGQTACDENNNLCICVDGQWQLSEYNSQKCLSGETHNECFPSMNNIVTCLPIPGSGIDRCDNLGFSKGCYCSPPSHICDDFHLCEPRVHRCIQQNIMVNISADNSNWDKCEDNPDCPGQRCEYSLDDEYAASTLVGTFGWEWGFWGVGVNVKVYGYLDGIGWTYLNEAGCEMFSDTGEFQMALNFSKQGISKLRFDCCSDTPLVNTKPKYFYGTLS